MVVWGGREDEKRLITLKDAYFYWWSENAVSEKQWQTTFTHDFNIHSLARGPNARECVLNNIGREEDASPSLENHHSSLDEKFKGTYCFI